MYNPPNKTLDENFFKFCVNRSNEFMILDRMPNAKIPGLNKKYNKTGKTLEVLLNQSDCSILNDNKEFTSYRFLQDHTDHSVLDYFIGTPFIANKCDGYETITTSICDTTS